jgi:Glycosyltransferase 61
MKPWRKRLGRSLSPKPLLGTLFSAIEDRSPVMSRILRYHSRTHELRPDQCFETIYRPIRVFEDRYVRQYEIVRNVPEGTFLSQSPDEQIPIHTAFVKDVMIHGHIKAPIDAKTGDAVAFYFPHSRIAWGDVYPLPWSRETAIEGDVIFIPHLTNIFHLLVEHVVPAITAVIRNRAAVNRRITIVSQIDFPILNFFTDYLNHAGFDAELKLISSFDKIHVERLVTSRAKAIDADFNYAYREELDHMAAFIDAAVEKIEVPEICYIERSHTPRRNILNQAELKDSLAQQGVTSLRFNFQNFLLQVAVFRKSRVIISAHGAALTNMIFSTPKQTIVEIFPENLRPKCYINMASQHGVDYHPLIGSPEVGNGHFSAPILDIKSRLHQVIR